jgi:ADP-ribose pyrophosphatase YjhB (NUDIX family)
MLSVMTYFPPENAPLPIPQEQASDALYQAAHENFVIAYTDLVVRNPQTNEFFFPVRGVEPEKGNLWFVGGRMEINETFGESAARHLKKDAGLEIDPSRFIDASHFGIGHVVERDNQDPHVRHADNTVMLVNLKPDEVAAFNKVKLSGEYAKGGVWYNPDKSKEKLTGPVKQFLRDYFGYQVKMGALEDLAKEEDQQRFPTAPQ